MHFNRKSSDDINANLSALGKYNGNSNRMIVIDSVKVDDQTRLTFTKRVKNVFPIISGDIVVVYQDIVTKDLVFKVQRDEKIVDSWLVKRSDIRSNSVDRSNPIGFHLKSRQTSYSSYPYTITTNIKPRTKSRKNTIVLKIY